MGNKINQIQILWFASSKIEDVHRTQASVSSAISRDKIEDCRLSLFDMTGRTV
jgi:hypothetical protein